MSEESMNHAATTEQLTEEQNTAPSIGGLATDRRNFLRTAAIVGAALCFADAGALRAAAVTARAEGKLVFTQATFNKFIVDAFKKSPTVRNQMIAESKANLSVFISKYFTLTDRQQNKLSQLTSADLATIHKSIDNAASANAPMQVLFDAPPLAVTRAKLKPPTLNGMRASAAIKSHRPGADDFPDDAVELGAGTTVYAMKWETKGTITSGKGGDGYSGSISVGGEC